MKFKALIAGLVAGTILMAQAGVTYAAGSDYFSDVTPDRADYNAITFMADMDLVKGYDDGTFKPDREVNRAEALKMIMGMTNMNYWQRVEGDWMTMKDVLRPMTFGDLDKNAWYMPYVQDAYEWHLVDGYPDGSFKPEQTVNTVEAVKILLNHTFLKADSLETVDVTQDPFEDADGTAWYGPYVQYARDRGILVGDSNNNIHPDGNITRGMLAQLIYRAYAYDGWTIDKKGVTVSLDEASGKYIVRNLGKEVARLDKIGTDGEEEAYIKKVTDRYAYISVCATGFGGYIWYDFCHGETYEIDLVSGSFGPVNFVDVEDNNTRIESFMDVYDDDAPYGALLAWTSDWSKHKIFISSASRGYDIKSFDVPEKYGQYGDVKFSPDGKKLAYAAIVGQPEDEESAVYIIDIATGEQTLVQTAYKQVMNVYGWNADVWNTDDTGVLFGVVTQS
jgi:hypothetical protein